MSGGSAMVVALALTPRAAWSAAQIVAVFGFLVVEARRAALNERRQRARGGIEPGGDVYRWMQLAYPGAFAGMIAEGALGDLPTRGVMLVGLACLLGGKALKWWAIMALGPCWTFRIVVVPGTAPVRTGPYQFLAHPNYVGVVGELLGLALLNGARITGPLALVVFGALMARRVTVENRARDAILRRS